MSGFLSAENFSIGSVSRVREGTRELLKAEFELAPLRKGAMSREGWFTVSPGEAWVLHEYECDQGDISVHGSIEYEGMQGGVPELDDLPFGDKTGSASELADVRLREARIRRRSGQRLYAVRVRSARAGTPDWEELRGPVTWLIAFSLLALVFTTGKAFQLGQ